MPESVPWNEIWKGSKIDVLSTPVPVIETEAPTPPMVDKAFKAAATVAAVELVGMETVVCPLNVMVS